MIKRIIFLFILMFTHTAAGEGVKIPLYFDNEKVLPLKVSAMLTHLRGLNWYLAVEKEKSLRFLVYDCEDRNCPFIAAVIVVKSKLTNIRWVNAQEWYIEYCHWNEGDSTAKCKVKKKYVVKAPLDRGFSISSFGEFSVIYWVIWKINVLK